MPKADTPGPDFEAVFASAPGNYLLLAPDFTILGVNDAYLAATSTVRAEILGRGLFDVFPDNPDDPQADGVRNLRASLLRVLEHGGPDRMAVQKYDIPRPAHEGGGFQERYWSPLNTPVLDAAGQVRYIIHWVEDVTEYVRLRREIADEQALSEERRVRAQRIEADRFLQSEALEASRQLVESERRYRFLASAVPQLIWTTDPEGRLEYANERYTTFTGCSLEELQGTGWREAIHLEDRDRVVNAWNAAVAAGTHRFQIEHRLRCHDGSWRWMLTAAIPYRDGDVIRRWYGTTTDIHDRVTSEEQLRHTQRLQAVGKLAGGMAHEVNNMMSAVLGFGELVLSTLGPAHPCYGDVEQMIRAGSRASQVTRELLAFSRQQVLKPVVLDVNVVVGELTPVLQNLLGSDRRLETVFSTRPVRVVADRGQLEQVLINLAANARDATGTNGVVIAETALVHLDSHPHPPAGVDDPLAGSMVRISVRDNGSGMEPEVAARVFEPFYTTKPVGQGTGLGLSMVHGFARQSGGDVQIESAPGVGTVVSVLLPQVEADVTREAPSPAAPAGTGESVLVVEDEQVVRSLVRRLLERQGYVVYQAPNGKAALDFMAAHPGVVQLVVTDIVMPFMNGLELADRMQARFPRVPVLLMSGYSGDEMLQRGLSLTGTPFIQKPVTSEALAIAVRERLDRVSSSLLSP